MKETIKWIAREEGVRLAAGALAPLLFLGVFCLYGLDVHPFLYAALLYWIMWAILNGIRLGKRIKLHRLRLRVRETFTVSGYTLPKAFSEADADYAALLMELAERIRQLTDDRLRERREASAYYTMWVHQIKTPIAAMRMLLQTEDTPMSRTLQAELFRIDQYAAMALNYIRLDESTHDLLFRDVKLDDLIRSVIRKTAPQFIQRKLALHYESTDAIVLTDEKWLAFILEQLLSNAIKYTPEGSITIAVSQDKILTVQDTGIGISKEDLPRIFEKGFTGRNGRADQKATGLGLYLCRRAADLLQISLTAESEPGRGSAFHLKLEKQRLM